MSTILVDGNYVVDASQTLAFTPTSGTAVYTLDGYGEYLGQFSSDPTFIDNGSISISSADTNASVTAFVDNGGLFYFNSLIKVAQGASLSVNATGAGSTAYGYASGSWPSAVENDGVFSVSAIQTAVGASLYEGTPSSGAPRFLNTGSFSVSAANATGVASAYPCVYLNSGTLTVAGTTSATGIAMGYFESGSVSNSGVITVTASSGTAYGITVGGLDQVLNITNTGRITAQHAIYEANSSSPAQTPILHLTNSGTINGDIVLGEGPGIWPGAPGLDGPGLSAGAQIYNTGAINGAIHLDINGNDLYDGRGGTQTGGIYLGSGTDTVYLGNDSETVYGGAGAAHVNGGTGADTFVGGAGDDVVDGGGGNDVLDGGGGSNTVTFASAKTGVTVSLALEGTAQNTGVGADTLSSFQALEGSSHNDTLEGGGQAASTLTGGLGADTFVYRSGDGAVTVTDFSPTQGDLINLSGVATFHDLSDVLAASSQVGSDTVIAVGSGVLRLQGVSMSSLTVADFTFPSTTVTGGSANNDTATVEGVYRQYSVGAGGSWVSGGPETANDTLVSVQRVQFVDGYLAYSPTDLAGEVYRLYEATLGRAPDPEGLAGWVNALNGGTSLQTVAGEFVNSTEFQNVYGALDDHDFVTLLYANVLHRGPDQGGLNYWLGLLNSGQDTRAQVVLGFSQSTEDINDSAAAVGQGLWVGNEDAAEVARLYDTTLGRLPDLQGLTGWTQALENGTLTLQQEINDFVASAEFQATYGSLTNTAFVTLLYENTLHRGPDPTGLTGWVTALNTGAATRAQVVQGFSESPEHIADTAPHIDQGIWLAG